MDGCRVCGGVTRWGRRLCAACGSHLGEYETHDSGRADLPIPVRRYGSAPPAPVSDAPPQAAPAPGGSPRRGLALARARAVLGSAVALAALVASCR